MIDFFSLLKTTNAYKTLIGEKKSNNLSHAYLIVTPDEKYLDEYLKIIAKIFLCKEIEPCLTCRTCKLIDQKSFVDAYFYPKEDSVKADDVAEIIEESYIKPIENDKKLFIISHAETMNTVAQNKLLKTLEEPPKGVYIIMGATAEYPLLSTVKSRTKKIEISTFVDDAIYNALKDEYKDDLKLKTAISAGDGTVGKAVALYEDEKLTIITDTVCDVLCNMQKSKDLLKYSNKITALNCDVTEFLSVLQLYLRELLVIKQNKDDLLKNKEVAKKLKTAEGFSTGAIVYAIDKVGEAFMRKKFNANDQMLIEWLLFQILEGKFKWQKS